ncbi:MAG: DinB family protein [Planctomycetota bacterium]
MPAIPRPAPGEHAPYYSDYVDQVRGDDALQHMAAEAERMQRTLAGLDDARAAHRYAEGKWSVKQVVGHVLDGERVFAYRALAFARGDTGELPGMDQDAWMDTAGFDARPIADLVDELRHVRSGTLSLFRSFSPEACARTGTASGNRFTVRSLVWITAGHATHHMNVLSRRYGVG